MCLPLVAIFYQLISRKVSGFSLEIFIGPSTDRISIRLTPITHIARPQTDAYSALFQVNKVYYITRANLKAAKEQFNTTKNDYEMTLNADSQVIPCEDEDTSSLPQMHFNFVPIGKLDTCEPNTFVGRFVFFSCHFITNVFDDLHAYVSSINKFCLVKNDGTQNMR